jgi:hypothetical protein
VNQPAAWWRLQKGDREQDYEMFFGYTWDVEVAKRQLQQVHGSLLETSGNGIGSISDKDEYGHTILHVRSEEIEFDQNCQSTNTPLTRQKGNYYINWITCSSLCKFGQ